MNHVNASPGGSGATTRSDGSDDSGPALCRRWTLDETSPGSHDCVAASVGRGFMQGVSAQTALVTGGAAGLGAVIVRTLASGGNRVVIADRDLNAARDLAGEVERAGGWAGAVAVGLSTEPSVRACSRPWPSLDH